MMKTDYLPMGRFVVNGIDLFQSATLGYIQCAQDLLSRNSDMVHSRDAMGRTPLHHAAFWGHKEIVVSLLVAGADVHARDKDGRTPLAHTAGWCTRTDIVQLLLDYGADRDARDAAGNSILYIAACCIRRSGHAWGNHAGLVQFLLDKGAKLDLFTAAILNRTSDAAELLSLSPDVINRRDCNVGNIVDHATALHRAAEWGCRETVELLLSHGADADACDARDRPPLYLAAHTASPRKMQPSPQVVDLLRARNTAPDIFACAVLGDTEQMTRLLREDSSLLHARDGAGNTPLHLAAWNDQHATIDILLAHGANPDIVNHRGETPTALAPEALALRLIASGATYDVFTALRLDVDFVAASLLQNPSAIPTRNRYGRLPMEVAAESGSKETIALLLNAGAEKSIWSAVCIRDVVSAADLLDKDPPLCNRYDNWSTPLHRAVAQGNLPMIELLIERGASIEATTIDSATPLICALWNGKMEIARYLAAQGANTEALDGWSSVPWIASALDLEEKQ